MASQEHYEKVKNLTKDEIIQVAKNCCGDVNDNEDFCEEECPYLDVREEEENPYRWCRQWVMHDLLKIINQGK